MNFKHHYNTKPSPGEKIFGESLTIQGQTISIAQMLQRINNGMPIDFSQMAYLNDDEPLPVIKDLTDLDNLRTDLDQFHHNRKLREQEFESNRSSKNFDDNKEKRSAGNEPLQTT